MFRRGDGQLIGVAVNVILKGEAGQKTGLLEALFIRRALVARRGFGFRRGGAVGDDLHGEGFDAKLSPPELLDDGAVGLAKRIDLGRRGGQGQFPRFFVPLNGLDRLEPNLKGLRNRVLSS